MSDSRHPEHPPTGAASAGGQPRLLIVDDNEALRHAVARRFRRRGYEVAEAATGRAALDAVAGRPPDLVLLDIMLPDLDGFEVLKRLRAEHTPLCLPVIMVTGRSRGRDVVRALELGANDYISKPLDFAVALARIQSQVAHKRAEDALRQARDEALIANREKSQFLASMSHELRTPLNSVLGFSELLEQEIHGELGDAAYRDYAGYIRNAGSHLLRLINELLDLSKIEAGQMRLSEGDFGLPRMIGEAVHLLGVRASEARVSVRCELAPEVAGCRGDEQRLKQTLLNLLANAIKFTPSGGCITISTRLGEGGVLRIAVADTGIGIAAADLAKLFKPYTQVEAAHSQPTDGTGLGLVISRRFVELHGGTLTLESEPGRGTTALVTLPADRVLRDARAAA